MFDYTLVYTNHKTFLDLKFYLKYQVKELFSTGEILALLQ